MPHKHYLILLQVSCKVGSKDEMKKLVSRLKRPHGSACARLRPGSLILMPACLLRVFLPLRIQGLVLILPFNLLYENSFTSMRLRFLILLHRREENSSSLLYRNGQDIKTKDSKIF